MNTGIVPRGLAFSVLGACLVVAAAAVPAAGQSVSVASRNSVQEFNYVFLRPNGWKPAVLTQPVTVKATKVPLDHAVNMIARQAGFDVVFEPGFDAHAISVSVEQINVPAAAVLLDVLRGTGLEAQVARTGRTVRIGLHASAASAWQAGGAVAGRVTDSATGHGVREADVFLAKTRWHAVTDSAGSFYLADVDAGAYTLVIRRFGYAPQERPVTVVEGQVDTVNLRLRSVVTRLNEVVTTATGRRRRVELGNDITMINADSIVRMEPVKSLTDILETRVPGLSVQHTSGAPGDPSRLRLRGAASPLRSNDPIVVVDGVRIYAEQSAARNANLADPSYAAPSPIDNIDPNTIETIEVIKGPSAATLYGQDAANGVIVITTKKGKAGPPRWTASAEHETTRIEGDYPNLMLRWGHLEQSNIPLICPVAGQPLFIGTNTNLGLPCVGDSIVRFQLLNDPALTILDKGQSTRATLGVSGGTAALTYALTGSFRDETGLLKLPAYEVDRYQTAAGTAVPDWMRRPQHLTYWSVTSNIGARLGAHADVALATSVTREVQQRSSLDNLLGELMSTYLDRATGTYYRQLNEYISASSLLGSSYFERVADAAMILDNRMNASWRPRTWLELTADAGLNWIQRSDQLYIPRYSPAAFTEGSGSADFQGRVNYGRGSTLLSTASLRGNIQRPLGYGFHFQFAAGANYTGKAINDLSVATSNLPEGQSLKGNTIDGVTPNKQNDATFGWYVEPAFNNSRLYLNLGLRLDGGSNYGGGITVPKFPKLSFSYLISDESFYPFKNLIPTLRLRLAYGRASRQPGVTDRLRVYGASQSVWVDGAAVTGVFLQHIGNGDLRPERTTELEGGFDTDLLEGRVQLSVTGYRKTTDDFLLQAPVAPSVYGNFVTQWRNIGVVRNTGLELSVDGQLIRSSPLTWTVGVGLHHQRNVVVQLGPGVEPFFTEGGANGSGTRVAPGYPLFGRWVRPILGYADGNGNGVIDQAEIQLGDTAVYVGATIPNYEADVRTNVSLWRRAVTVSANLQYQDGLSQKNDVAQDLVVFSPGRNDPTASPAEQVATSTVSDYNWIQTVNTARLTSVSVSYQVPSVVARRLGAQTLSVAVQGRNLGLWTNYRGLDPNVNAFSTGNGVLDTGVLPLPRSWQVRVNATY